MYNSICCQLVNFYLQNNYKNKMKQTAVEWLKMQLEIRSGIKEITVDSKTFEELCEQAKEMEKEQIIDAVIYGNTKPSMVSSKILGEQYYNETFKSE